MIGISASSHPVNGAGTTCVLAMCANDPRPADRPNAMNAVMASTFTAASTLWTKRPDPCRCTIDSVKIAPIATSACGVTTSGRYGSGSEASGVLSAAAGRKRPRYSASATVPAAIAPENPATNDVQPERNAASGPNASRR